MILILDIVEKYFDFFRKMDEKFWMFKLIIYLFLQKGNLNILIIYFLIMEVISGIIKRNFLWNEYKIIKYGS